MGCFWSKRADGGDADADDPNSITFFDAATAVDSGVGERGGETAAPTLKESAEISTTLLDVVGSFCGQGLVDNPYSSGSAGDASLSAEARAADVPVTFTPEEQAAFAAQQAEEKDAALKMLLQPNGGMAEAAAVFVEGRGANTSTDMATFMEQLEAATIWLIAAIKVAFLDPEIAAAAKQLLGTVKFTRNLSAARQWDRLQTELSKVMAEIGERQLAPLYKRFDLGNILNTKTVNKLWSVHPDAAAASHNLVPTSSSKMKKPSQEVALPALMKLLRRKLRFDAPAEMAERVALHVMRILNALLNDRFQDMMAAAAKAVGCKHHRAGAKGYARSLVKLYKDYLQLPSPRAAFVLDGLRTLLTGDGVLSVQAAIREINRLFGGLVQLKNPFTLTEEQQTERCHLLLLNLTGIADFDIDFGTLLAEPEADRVMVELRTAPDGEPASRWRTHFDQAKALLNDASLRKEPVKLCVEVQITLTSSADARGEMHYAYDVGRADDEAALFTNFAGVVEEKEATDVWVASQVGQLLVVQRLLAEEGAWVNAIDDVGTGSTPLYLAVGDNHPDVVGFLLDNGADVNLGKSITGATPLFSAAQGGFGDVVAQLVAANADVNQATTDDGRTPLFMAATKGHEKVVAQLVAANADVNQATTSGVTPLEIAAHDGHEKVVAQLVAANADVNQAKTNGVTPLYIAADKGHENVVAQLVAANADVNQARTDIGATPLYIAAEKWHEKVVAQLVAANADVNQAKSDTGATPLYIAAEKGHEKVVVQLVAANADVNQATTDTGAPPLFMAALKGHEKVVEQLVAAHADVNQATTYDGTTPLYIAAEKWHEKVVAQLVAANADVNQAKSDTGATPLYIAAEKGHEKVVVQLVAANADVNQATTDKGATPLFKAASNGHEKEVAHLVAANADVNQATTDKGATPLFMAARKGHEKVVEQLVAANAGVNQATTDNGLTPLLTAVQKGHENVVAQLLAANADVNQATTDKGTTPRMMAALMYVAEAAKLLAANADENQATTSGDTPCFIANTNSHAAIATMLTEAGAT